MPETRYRICRNRAEALAKQPCWFVEKSIGLDVVDTTNYFPSKFRAMYEATRRWPEMSPYTLTNGRAA